MLSGSACQTRLKTTSLDAVGVAAAAGQNLKRCAVLTSGATGQSRVAICGAARSAATPGQPQPSSLSYLIARLSSLSRQHLCTRFTVMCPTMLY
ncbi:hypothetical protein KCU62_g263, partial [Aureobasidium sp. EXF-3399]